MNTNHKCTDYLIILIILFLGTWQLFLGTAVMKWDIIDISLPWRFFVTESLNNHLLPLWNPYMNSGFAQNGDPGTWYPVSWIIGFLSRYSVRTIQFEYLIHLYIAGFGMYQLGLHMGFSRITRLILSVIYMLSGFMIGNAQHFGWIISAAWLPFIILYFLRLQKSPGVAVSLKFAFVLFLMLSGGYPGIFITTVYLLAGYQLYYLVLKIGQKHDALLRKQLLYLLMAIAAFVIFSLVVLVSSFDLSQYITRGQGLQYTSTGWGLLTGSLPPKGLLTVIFPFAAAQNNPAFWEADFSLLNCYFGLLPLILILFANLKTNTAKVIRLHFLLGIFFMLLAMAETVPLRKWLLFLPFMDLFRLSTLFRLFSIFYFLIAAGYAFDELFKESNKNRIFFFVLTGVSAILFLTGIGLMVNLEWWKFKTIMTEGWESFISVSGIKERLFLQTITAFIVVTIPAYFLVQKIFAKVDFRIVALLICSADIIIASQLNLYATVVTKIPMKQVNYCFSDFPQGIPFPSLKENLSRFNDSTLKPSVPYLWRNLPTYFKFPSSDGNSPYTYLNLKKALANGNYDSIINRPFLFLAKKIEQDSTVNKQFIDTASYRKIVVSSFDHNKFEARVSIDTTQYLVLLQNCHPHWQVSVNNNRHALLKVNDTFMAMKLEPGVHNVSWRFSPVIVVIAAYISMFSWICFLVFILFYLFRLIHNQQGKKMLVGIVLILVSGTTYGIYRNLNRPTNDSIYAQINAEIEKNVKSRADSPRIMVNVDNPAAIRCDYSNLTFFNVLFKEDMKCIYSGIEGNGSQLLYIQANRIHYPEIPYLIRSTYPKLYQEKKTGALLIAGGKKSGSENHEPDGMRNDFEDTYKYWSTDPSQLDSVRVFSGRYSCRMDSNSTYSSTFRVNYSELDNEPKKVIGVDVFISGDGMSQGDVFLVIDISRKGKRILWKGEDAAGHCMNDGLWHKIFLAAEIDQLDLKQGDTIKIYFWNKNKRTFRIDDFTIRTY
ncbi:MAG: YfhO family protein [Bacteroidales bacterium]|nr:YfhO family protein [Bacteroidales bacterium]